MPRKLLVTFKPKTTDRNLISKILGDYIDIIYLHEITSIKDLEDVEIILSGSGMDLENIIEKTLNLKFIQLLAAGADAVPFSKIRNNVIVATNSGANAIPVAEHAIALLLSAAKRIVEHTVLMRNGVWKRRLFGDLIYGKKLGIIGFGNIGKEIAKRVKAFGMKILAINRSGKTNEKVDFIGDINSLNYVLENSDYVILSLPLTKHTRGLINRDKLNKMKKNAVLVNISRGGVIVEKDLYEHLKENPNFIAALDVWWQYPEKDQEKCFQKYPFHKLNNVIMTPHIAGFTKEIREKVIESALLNILKFIQTKHADNIVDKNEYLI